MKFPQIILLTVPGCQPILCKVIEEDEGSFKAEYPLMLFKEDSYLYSLPYIPFAKSGIVSFNKDTVISVSLVDAEMEQYFNKVVVELKELNTTFKVPNDSEEKPAKKIPELKARTIH